jgi:agmatinase
MTIVEPQEAPAGELAARVRAALAGAAGVYVSIDLDGLDPAYAPGVANPEPGGLTSRQVMGCLAALRDVELRGFDVLELAPAYDAGGISAAAAARLLAELCCLVALQRGTAGGG